MPNDAYDPPRNLDVEARVTDALAAHIGRLTADFVRVDLIAQHQANEIGVLTEARAQARHDLDRLTARLALAGAADHPEPAQDFGA